MHVSNLRVAHNDCCLWWIDNKFWLPILNMDNLIKSWERMKDRFWRFYVCIYHKICWQFEVAFVNTEYFLSFITEVFWLFKGVIHYNSLCRNFFLIIIIIICLFRLILTEYFVVTVKESLYTYKNQASRRHQKTQMFSGQHASWYNELTV